MILRSALLAVALCVCLTQAIVIKDSKRREGFDKYGPPPRPAPQYGPPPSQSQRIPHHEYGAPQQQYGVPQQIPFRDYGPPALKYGPPKLNFLGGGGGGSGGGGGGNSFHEQVNKHFGVPKPFYGPPHIQHKPSGSYGPPPQQQYGPPKPQQQYGPPRPQYGAPPPQAQYGPPPKQQYGPPPHRPSQNYGPPPRPNYGPPPPQSLPSTHPAPQFKPERHPASSYGPPPSGPLNIPPKQNYGPPDPGYGPPPLPIQLPINQGPSFGHQVPETTIILQSVGGGGGHGGGTGGGHHGGNFGGSGGGGGPANQVEIQIDSAGHTHSVSGSQAPFHTACDGWKPIPAPAGAFIENNHIDTQSGYSHVAQGISTGSGSSGGHFGFGTQYNGGGGSAGTGHGGSGGSGGSSIIDGLTDEQLVAVALQSGGFEGPNTQQHQSLPPSGPAGDFGGHQSLNSIESEALQVSLGSIDDTYSRPPSDSFGPGSSHAQKYNTASGGGQGGGFGGNYGPPPPPNGNYGPPPHGGNHGPPPPNGNYGPPSHGGSHGPPPGGNFGPPPHGGNHGPRPPPGGNYGPPPPPGSNYGPPPPSAAAFVNEHHSSSASSSSAQAGLQYGSQSGNVHSFPPHGGIPPSRPVSFRPPVPLGLLESIGATVQHLDQFGVKPQDQSPTYIPPAANEIAGSGPGNFGPEYGPPPENIIEQQLPQQQSSGQVFIQIEEQHGGGNANNQYGPPPPPPQQQYLPTQGHGEPRGPPDNQYVPPPPTGPSGGDSYHQSGGSYENQHSSSQYNQQFVQSQGLPLQQEPRFTQVHDCGQGPNLVGASYQFQQQQGQQYANAASGSSYNSISQSIPIAEQHTQFISDGGPTDSYGPPASGNDFDHDGFASQKSSVAALPDGTDPQSLPGLDGLNVISAQKSQSIHLTEEQAIAQQQKTSQPKYQLQIAGNNGGQQSQNGDANHDEILSQGLLQSILTAIEQPQRKNEQHNQQAPEPRNPLYIAQSRADTHVNEDATAVEENEPAEAAETAASTKIEVKAVVEDEEQASVKEIKPIIAAEVDDADIDESKH